MWYTFDKHIAIGYYYGEETSYGKDDSEAGSARSSIRAVQSSRWERNHVGQRQASAPYSEAGAEAYVG
jgi:hypothetical protein